ncbi:group II intron reverse transcriptase/maturase [Eubacterium sp. An3]|uniref:group II intron reverse transcriptase/maturase n=1 Tax=Eubacterium sp. An3 TaxID=1965628 RepID=UPI000B36FCB1|nr:group II intron reverse transcriptase/maturase [Eubacterium sp. An3]OUO25405.1 group II intron reverse transcriptase/maturase [Eubacterium sp. An3]
MAKQSKKKTRSIDSLRHAEYYEMQEIFDDLYAKSRNGETFTNLIGLILSRENILLAYRNIKSNTGSKTPGTDGMTITDIGKLTPEEVVEKVRYIVTGSKHGYRPKPVRRKEIPKPNGKTRPLGIPCIWDRLVQQCILQVMEPVCEARFSENSHGFRPNRSAEHAIAATYRLLQQSHLDWVVEFDIEGFFDNVNHPKLIRQLWAMGIHDKHLIYVVRQILKAPIKMPNGKIAYPEQGTPQGGILSPLLANVVLNELDQWVDSQWQKNPVTQKYSHKPNKSGAPNYNAGYIAMRKTELKEMYIVRYADDFRIFCRTKDEAIKAHIAVTLWLSERLKLKVSAEKTRIVNVKSKPMEFLGFKIRLRKKGQKYVVRSHMGDKAFDKVTKKLVSQAKNIANPRGRQTVADEIRSYNAIVVGEQNYYRIATEISQDCGKISHRVMTVLMNRLKEKKKGRLKRNGRALTGTERKRYGESAMLRYEAHSQEPIYPVGYIQFKKPIAKKRNICSYTKEGRKGLHDNMQINPGLLLKIMRTPSYGRSTEYMDNRVSLFSAQAGKCAVTGINFQTTEEVHCHHKTPKDDGGTDKYDNLVLVLEDIHRLIYASKADTINRYLEQYNLNKKQLEKLNEYRLKAGTKPLPITTT